MVSATIPDYRATGIAIERDLERVRRLGVDFRYGVDVGSDVSLASLRREGFAAVVIAVGARRGRPLGLVHEDSAQVVDGLDFLRAARSGRPPTLGRRIGIIGGGDVAMDCARTALRLCSGEVTVFYRRTRSEMPAQAEEIGDLLDEGGRLVELTAPKALEISEGRLDRVIMWRMRPGEKDTSGRRRPEIVPGSEHPVELDTMIVAIGQIPDLGFLGDEDVVLDDSGFLQVDPETLETSLPDVYAGGDIIGDGPASIVKAAGDGRRIAEAILVATAGSTIPEVEAIPSWPAFDRTNLLVRRARIEQRVIVPQRPPSDRKGFEEVVQTLSREQAVREAARCVDCDVMCSTCEGVCPNRAIITYTATPGAVELPAFEVQDGRLVHTGGVSHQVAQAPQVAVLTDACNECGNCVTFCPTAGRPWRDKPRLYLHRGDFEAQDGNAFMLLRTGDRRGIQARFEGELHELIEGDVLRYVSPEMVLHLHPTTLEVVNFAVRVAGLPEQSLDTEQLGTMITLFRSLAASMPELPTVEAQPEWLIRPDVDPS
jgi:putative selenate reductase